MPRLPNYIPLFLLTALCLSCGEGHPSGGIVTADCPKPKKIIVYKENVYDLSGYADEGGGDPFRLFDENQLVDPLNKPDGAYKPHTNPQPTQQQAIYFPKGKGNRIVIDLRTTYHLTDVFLYDRGNSADSVWIYTGDMRHWKQKAAFRTIEVFQSSQWRRFPMNDGGGHADSGGGHADSGGRGDSGEHADHGGRSVDDSVRYIMIRFSSPKAAIDEMVLYGCTDNPIPPRRVEPANNQPFAQKTMKEFLGVNDYSGIVDAKWLKPFYYTRLYSFAVDFDRDTVDVYPQVKYNMTHFGYWDAGRRDYHYWPEDNVKENHHQVWYTMQGLPLWMAKDERDKKGRPVTKWGMDPEDALSYGRHGAMMWNLAAWFGNVKWDTGLLSLDHQPKFSGRGTMRLYENGNEEDAFWTGERYCNPMAYFAQSNADYDGAERALGDRCGIANADSGSALITSGLIGLDTNRVRVYKFLCRTLRKDGAFIWKGGVQYHYYSTAGGHGISPEEDSLRWRLAKVAAFTHDLEPGVPCILGENGYDKSQHTRQSTPLLPGHSAEESQAVFILRSVNATAFSGFDSYILYWLRDTKPVDAPDVYLTSGVLREMPDESIRPYPSWFYLSTFVGRLADYRPDRIVSEKGPVWIYKYRHAQSPDSVAYFVYAPTHNGASVPGFALKVGDVAGDAVEVDFAAASAQGVAAGRKVKGGIVTIGVGETPTLVFVKEKK
jgi:hypothetical protein